MKHLYYSSFLPVQSKTEKFPVTINRFISRSLCINFYTPSICSLSCTFPNKCFSVPNAPPPSVPLPTAFTYHITVNFHLTLSHSPKKKFIYIFAVRTCFLELSPFPQSALITSFQVQGHQFVKILMQVCHLFHVLQLSSRKMGLITIALWHYQLNIDELMLAGGWLGINVSITESHLYSLVENLFL